MSMPAGLAFLAFLVLVAACGVAMYGFRISPRSSRQWTYLAIAIAFLAWVLPFMTSLRSR
jgi:hypothetical protein